jgi:hypothetical protein
MDFSAGPGQAMRKYPPAYAFLTARRAASVPLWRHGIILSRQLSFQRRGRMLVEGRVWYQVLSRQVSRGTLSSERPRTARQSVGSASCPRRHEAIQTPLKPIPTFAASGSHRVPSAALGSGRAPTQIQTPSPQDDPRRGGKYSSASVTPRIGQRLLATQATALAPASSPWSVVPTRLPAPPSAHQWFHVEQRPNTSMQPALRRDRPRSSAPGRCPVPRHAPRPYRLRTSAAYRLRVSTGGLDHGTLLRANRTARWLAHVTKLLWSAPDGNQYGCPCTAARDKWRHLKRPVPGSRHSRLALSFSRPKNQFLSRGLGSSAGRVGRRPLRRHFIPPLGRRPPDVLRYIDEGITLRMPASCAATPFFCLPAGTLPLLPGALVETGYSKVSLDLRRSMPTPEDVTVRHDSTTPFRSSNSRQSTSVSAASRGTSDRAGTTVAGIRIRPEIAEDRGVVVNRPPRRPHWCGNVCRARVPRGTPADALRHGIQRISLTPGRSTRQRIVFRRQAAGPCATRPPEGRSGGAAPLRRPVRPGERTDERGRELLRAAPHTARARHRS